MSIYILCICVILVVRELRKLYATVRGEERSGSYETMATLLTGADCDRYDRDFIISEQCKIIDRLRASDLYNKRVARHYRQLYLWRDDRRRHCERAEEAARTGRARPNVV